MTSDGGDDVVFTKRQQIGVSPGVLGNESNVSKAVVGQDPDCLIKGAVISDPFAAETAFQMGANRKAQLRLQRVQAMRAKVVVLRSIP